MIRLAVLCYQRWRLTLLLIAVMTLALLPQLRRVVVDLSAESLYPSAGAAVKAYQRINATFGSDEIAAIYAEHAELFSPARLAALEKIHVELKQLPFIERIESLQTLPDLRDEAGMISSAPVLAKTPTTQPQADRIRQRAVDHPLLRGQLVSADGTALMMLLRLSEEARQMTAEEKMAKLEAVLSPHGDQFTHLFQMGEPLTQSWMRAQLARDQWLIMPLALGLVLVLLTLTQRNLWAGILPIVNAGIAIIWALAWMTLFGIPVNLLNSILPALILIIGATSDVHVIHEFREHLQHGHTGLEAMRETARRLALPLLLTSTTTVLGFATTALSEMPILRDFGWAATLAMSGRFLLSSLFLPACLRLLEPWLRRGPQRTAAVDAESWTHRFAASLVTWLFRHARLIMLTLAVLCGLAIWQATAIQTGNDWKSFIRRDSPVRVRDAVVSQKLAGLNMISLSIRADRGEFLEPRALRQLEALGKRLRQLPGVASVTSFADLLTRMNQQLQGGGTRHAQVPQEARAVQQLMLFLHPTDYRAYLTPDFAEACLQIRCQEADSTQLRALEAEIRRIMEDQEINTNEYVLTGSPLLVAAAVDEITQGQVMSLGGMMLSVFLIVWGLFLSPRSGVTTLIVNVFPVAMIFGLMGLFGISLNVGTCMVAAITLGIAVDDTLHLLVRFNREARDRQNEREGIEVAIREELAPIATTAAALAAGFAVLGLSSFQPVREFGLLSAGVMLLGVVTDMVVTPVLFGRTRIVTLWDVLGLNLRRSLLETSPFFRGLTSWQARRLILLSHVVEHRRDEMPVRCGEVGDSLFVVLAGDLEASVETPTGRQVLRDLHAGDVFGEMAFVTRQPRTADVTVVREARLLKINFEELSKLRRFSPYLASQLLYNIARILCDRASHPGTGRSGQTAKLQS